MDSPSAKAKLLEKATHLQPVPVQKTLLMINHFSVSTVTFLNQFVRTVDERLEVFSKSMDKLDVLLAILEAKLEKIEGPPAPAPAPAAATTEATPASQDTATAAAPAMAPNATSGAPPPPPPGGGPPPPPGGGPPPPPGGIPPPPPGAGAGTAAAAASPPPPAPAAAASAAVPGSVRADPRYAQYFTMLASGTPKNEVVFKMQSAGLNASLLDTPDAPAPAAGAPNGAAGESPMLEIMDAPSTVLKCKDDPAFKKYFRMLNIGIPEGNVKQKMTTDGVDPSILDTPDGPSPNDPASTAVM